MDVTMTTPEGDVTQRNIWWSMEITRLLIDSEELRNAVPEGATLFVFPEDDEELCRYNLGLANQARTVGTVVFVEIPTTRGFINLQRVHAEPPQQFVVA